jgi:hypothetical protein
VATLGGAGFIFDGTLPLTSVQATADKKHQGHHNSHGDYVEKRPRQSQSESGRPPSRSADFDSY